MCLPRSYEYEYILLSGEKGGIVPTKAEKSDWQSAQVNEMSGSCFIVCIMGTIIINTIMNATKPQKLVLQYKKRILEPLLLPAITQHQHSHPMLMRCVIPEVFEKNKTTTQTPHQS